MAKLMNLPAEIHEAIARIVYTDYTKDMRSLARVSPYWEQVVAEATKTTYRAGWAVFAEAMGRKSRRGRGR